MAERSLNTTLKKRLINNEPFVYAHLIKYERPAAADVSGKHSTDAKRYAYLTDGMVNIVFDDGSYATDGTTANGNQTYIADKIYKIGSYSETSQAKATGMTLELGAESLYNSFSFIYPAITASAIDFGANNSNAVVDLIEQGIREGDKVLLTTDDDTKNNGKEVRVTGIRGTNNHILDIATIDNALVTSSAETITLQIVSDELKGPLIEMNDATLKSYHNRDVFIYKAFLDPDDYSIIGAPNLVFKGIISSAALKEDPSKSMRVSWKLTSHWGDFTSVNGRWTNDAVHRALDQDGIPQPELALKEIYAKDMGFQHSDITMHILATYTAIEKETKFKKQKNLWGLLPSTLKPYEVDVEVEREVDLNWALSAKYIPVVYGVDRITGIPIFVDTKSTDPNNIFIVYALAEGEIGGIYDLYIEDEPSICSNLEDWDDRNVGGTDTNGATNSASEIDVVCRGRADKGETLGGTNVSGTSAASNRAASHYRWRGGPELDNLSIHYYEIEGLNEPNWNDLDLDKTTKATDGSGVLDGQYVNVTSPNRIKWSIHCGSTEQAADDTLVTIAEGDKFKRQADYFSEAGQIYWTPNHTLSDTAYVVMDCEIAQDATTVPEVEYVVRGKYVNSYNYDFSYVHDSTVTITGAEAATHFSVGDTVDLKNSAGTVINDDVIIIDKWTMYGPEGVETRFRFSDAPELGYSNGIPSVTSFYMENSGSKTWHMVTYNHAQNSGTVGEALTATGETSIVGGLPQIELTSDPGWVDIFPDYLGSSDQLPIAFTDTDLVYKSDSFPVTSTSNTVLTLTGYTSTGGFEENTSDSIIRTDAIKLVSSPNANDDYYNDMTITLNIENRSTGNTTTQIRKIVDYDGGTGIAQVNVLWDKGKEPYRDNTTYEYTYNIKAITDRRVSINPAMQLLDYMTSQTYGKRLDIDKDIALSDWLLAARTCDSRGTQTLGGTASSISATAGDRYVLTSNGNADGDIIAMGRVQSTVSSSTTVIMEECFGKFSKTFMKNRHSYVVGDIVVTASGYYRCTSAGTKSTEPTGSNPTGWTGPLTGVTLRKLDDLSNTTITVKNVSDSIYSDYTDYSIYNSDFVKYWRYLGWEDHHQRWVTRHQLCGTLDTATSVFDNINGFLRQFNGLLSYESGLYVLKIETTSDTIASDKTAESGYTLGVEKNVRYITNDDIIGSIKVTDPGPKKAYNTMTSTIGDPGSRFQGKQVSFYDSEFLRTDKNVIKSGSHTQPACHNYFNARINVENALRKSRFGMKITFKLGPKALLLLTGETIAITYDKFGWSGKKWRISNITYNTDCTASITAVEYDDSFYTISTPKLPSIINEDIRGPVPAVLGTPNSLAADTVTMGNIDLTWINGSNVAPANKTEIWVASSNDRTKANLLTEVPCSSSIQQRVNGAVSNGGQGGVGGTVTLDSGNGVLVGQLITGTGIDGSVTVAAISGTTLTLSSAQTLADNVLLNFDNTGSYQHSVGEDAQAKYYWIRHKKFTSNNIPKYSAWHPTSATAGVTATSTIPEIFYSVTVTSDAQIFNADSDGDIQNPAYIKFTATKNALDAAFVWSTSPSVDLYDAATDGSTTTSGTSVWLREGDFSGTSVAVTATVTSTPTERTAGADNTYFETVTIPKVTAGTDATGADAKTVRIRSSSYIFKEAIDGTVAPDYIQFDAVKQNTTANAYWQITDDSPAVTLYTNSNGTGAVTEGTTSGTAANTVYLLKAQMSTNTDVTVTLTCDDITDITNIVQLEEGSGTVIPVLSNPMHVLPADYLGAVSNTQAQGSGTNIRVYEGVQALTFVTGTPGAGEWALSVGNTANITEGGVTDNGTYATIGDHTGVATGTDTYTITYTISGKTRKAEAFTNFTVDQYLTKAKAGADGVIGYSARLEASDYSVVYNAAGASPSFTGSGGNITLTATEIGFTDPYYRWNIADAGFGSWTDGLDANTFTVPTSIFSPSKVMKVEVREGSSGTDIASDSISIYGVQPGTDGSAGLQFVELQIQYQGTAGSYAPPSTPTGGSYNFDTPAFTPPTNWTLALPEGESKRPVWLSIATASAVSGGTDSSITWTSPALLDPGREFIDIFYKKAATIPTPPTSNVNSTPVGWSTTIPSGSDTLWQVIATGELDEGNYYRYYFGPVTQVSFASYTVICTNEAYTYSSDITGGGVVTTNSGTSFEVYRDDLQLTGVLTGTPTVDQFKVTATGTNITPSSTYGGAVTSQAVVFADHTAGTIMSGVGNLSASISYSIAISTGARAQTVTKKQTFIKTLKPKAPVGNFTYITAGEIERNSSGDYDEDYLDIDFTFNEEGAAVARDRFRIVRSSDTWSGTLGTPGAHASGDLATGLLGTGVTVNGKAAVLKVTYTDSAGVTSNVSAPVKISHDGVGNFKAFLYKLNDTSLTSTTAGTFADPNSGNADWSETVPSLAANEDKVYVSSRRFTEDGESPQDDNWSTPTIHSQRIDGSPAVNSRYPTLYRKNSNTYDTDGGTFADPRTDNTNWTYAVPGMDTNGDIVYAMTRIFTSDGNSPQEAAWSTPAIYATRVDGATVTGPAGQGVRQANIYKLNDTTLSDTDGGTFADPRTGNTDWSFDVPDLASNGDIIYVATRTFSSNALSPQDSAWSTPAIYAQREDGEDGTSAVSASLSNDSHSLPASSTGVVSSYSGSGTTIKVYEGTTALTFQTGTVLAGQFAVAIGDTSGITEGGATGDESTTCTIGAHSAAADGTDSFVITYTITGKIADGTSFSTITKTQTLTKQKEGGPGDPGDDGTHGAAYYSITSGGAGVTSAEITNTKIQTATGRNFTPAYVQGDTCTVVAASGTAAPASYNRTSSAWEAATMQIDGSLVATGTIAGGAIQSATTITVGSAGQVLIDGTTNRILITD